MRPQFQALAHDLIDGYAERGWVEFVREFAEPYAARIICLLLGLPDDEWPQVAHWADDLGKSFRWTSNRICRGSRRPWPG